jgi:hypothetical protein
MTVGKVITEASMSLDGFIAKQDPLSDPTVCIQGKQVTHLVFPVAHS